MTQRRLRTVVSTGTITATEVGETHVIGRATVCNLEPGTRHRFKARALQKGLENVDARLEVGNPAARILKCIETDDIDCVIMGSRGLNNIKGLFLGSVSHKIASRAACTCITVK